MKKSTFFLASTTALALIGAGVGIAAESPAKNTLVYFESNDDLGDHDRRAVTLTGDIDHMLFVVGDRTVNDLAGDLELDVSDTETVVMVGNLTLGQIEALRGKFGEDIVIEQKIVDMFVPKLIDSKMSGIGAGQLETIKSATYTGLVVGTDQLPSMKSFFDNLGEHVTLIDFDKSTGDIAAREEA
jgi:hypothetical protein